MDGIPTAAAITESEKSPASITDGLAKQPFATSSHCQEHNPLLLQGGNDILITEISSTTPTPAIDTAGNTCNIIDVVISTQASRITTNDFFIFFIDITNTMGHNEQTVELLTDQCDWNELFLVGGAVEATVHFVENDSDVYFEKLMILSI